MKSASRYERNRRIHELLLEKMREQPRSDTINLEKQKKAGYVAQYVAENKRVIFNKKRK